MAVFGREGKGEPHEGSPLGTDRGMAEIVKRVIKDMDRNIPLDKIAERQQIPRDLAEMICRMYVTHPGIDVDGILNRIM